VIRYHRAVRAPPAESVLQRDAMSRRLVQDLQPVPDSSFRYDVPRLRGR
jgi:hypothetical protein